MTPQTDRHVLHSSLHLCTLNAQTWPHLHHRACNTTHTRFLGTRTHTHTHGTQSLLRCVNSSVLICEDGSEKEEFWREIGGRGLPLAAEEAGLDEEAEEKYFDVVKCVYRLATHTHM